MTKKSEKKETKEEEMQGCRIYAAQEDRDPSQRQEKVGGHAS